MPRPVSRLARNTAIFSIATGLSRVAGLAREVVASAYFGTSGAFSAFTIANQVPNVVRSLFADAALSAAFVPVFTELQEQGKRREAFRLATSLFVLMALVLSLLTVVFTLLAPALMPLFTSGEFSPELDELAVGLSQVLFPIVVVLALTGLVTGVLNAQDHFSVPALSPLVWNVVIIAFLVAGRGWFEGDDELYAYAIGILVATVVQLLMVLPVLKRVGFEVDLRIDLRDPRVKQVLTLMLPVTLSLGLINFNAAANSVIGGFVSEEVPRAIEAAFRVYMLPQGLFSVAIATVLFPTLARLAARADLAGLRDQVATGTRLILLLLLPAAALTLVLAEPVTRLLYERGDFDAESTDLVSTALIWFSLSLPLNGMNLLLTRTFFSLQRPWAQAWLAGLNLLVNLAVSLALYKPFGIGGVVAGTVAGNVVLVGAQLLMLRPLLGGRLGLGRTAADAAKMLGAAAALAGVGYVGWWALDELLGRGLLAQVVAVGLGSAAGLSVYAGLVLVLGVPEAARITRLLRRR